MVLNLRWDVVNRNLKSSVVIVIIMDINMYVDYRFKHLYIISDNTKEKNQETVNEYIVFIKNNNFRIIIC